MGCLYAGAAEPARVLSNVDVDSLADLIRQIEVVSDSASPALGEITSWLSALVPGLTVLMRPTLTEHGWDVEYLHSAGLHPSLDRAARAHFAQVLATAPRRGPITTFNPLWVEERRRNRVVAAHGFTKEEESLHIVSNMRGILGNARMSTMLCDGPLLLGCVASFRKTPYRRREQAIFQAISEPLRRRVRWERSRSSLACPPEAWHTVLEAIDSPAFLVRRTGSIEHANAMGSRWLDFGNVDVFELLEAARASVPIANSHVDRYPLGVPGDCWGELLILRLSEGARERRALRARQSWHLSDREVDVLLLVAEGLSNKDLAVRSRLSLKTIEWHVSSLLKKARVESRTQLVARFWQL